MPPTPRKTCFVDMPFGRKTDARSGVEIDFDQVYEAGIRPAVEGAGLECIRGDREITGGLIHTAMFARLLVAEFVIADMTTANANVFYELGIRHAARPYATIPIFSRIGAPPFDVNGVRAIPYVLTDGRLAEPAAQNLVQAIRTRIQGALTSPVAPDSPLFQLFDRYPGVTMSHEVTDVFRDRVMYAEGFRTRLAAARAAKPKDEALRQLEAIEGELGLIATTERGVVVDLLLSYRAVEAVDRMVALVGRMSGDLQGSVLVQQQLAFALNRRKQPGDRDRAIAILQTLRRQHGDSAETLGLLGRIYKDLWQQAVEAGSVAAAGYLEQALDAYRGGFNAEPLDYYPGINALTLLLAQGSSDAMAEHAKLAPLVTFAAVRKGGERANDYWTLATMVELGCHGRDDAMAHRCLPRAVALVHQSSEAWMLKSTLANLRLIAQAYAQAYGSSEADPVERLVQQLQRAVDELERPPA